MSGYAPNRYPPPPGGGGQAPRFPPPPPAAAGNFAPPPPPAAAQPTMPHLNNAMGHMAVGGGGGAPRTFPPATANAAPMGAAAPPAPGMFRPPPPAFAGGAPQAPQSFAPPAAPPGAPQFFQPQPGAGFAQGSSGPPPPPGAGTGFAPPGGGGGMMPPAAQSQFYPQGPMDRAPGGVPGMAPQQPASNENIDYSITIPERFFRFTAGKLPQTAAQGTLSKIPFGAVLRPMAPTGYNDEEIDTVQPGTAGIIRCKRCRTYVNAFCSWLEQGRRWRCNICGQLNDTHSGYFCHLDESGLRRDRFDRPELSKGIVEFIAPAEYMVRPPQEPTYFFVIDVTEAAVQSGMLQSVSEAIKASLDDLPGRGRTKIGFITFDTGVHYYNLDSDLANPQMLVVSDLKELFVPLPENLLVNLKESRTVVESFLDSLPEMFAKNPVQGRSCLGPALKAAFTVTKQIGGKMCVFQSMQPNLGDGALRPREQPGIMGTPKESSLLKPHPENTWYKDTGVEFSRQQISVDMFLFPYQYMDLAALGELAKVTAGSMRSYVMFNREKDGPRFEHDLKKTLTTTTAFESVMRIRCTKGMRITNFYGNFYIRGTDLMALPNCNADSVFGFDLAHDEQNLSNSHVTIQAALLYTSSNGQRRIRVMTQALPVTGLTSEVVASIDADACTALLSKQAIEVTLKSGLDNARMRLQQVCIEMLRTARGGDKRTVSGYSVPPPPGQQGGQATEEPIPENLALLPLYTLALMKNVAFRGGTDVHPDERVQSFHLLHRMWVSDAKRFIYPRLFALHDMGHDAGYATEDDIDDPDRVAGRDRILLPPAVNLSIDSLSSEGVYLLDNGVELYLWVGRSGDMSILTSLFGVHTLEDMDPNQIQVQTSGDPFASRFGAIVSALSEEDGNPDAMDRKINIIREGDPAAEARFYWFLVEDRAAFQGGTYSYEDFLNFVKNPNASAGGGRGPPGPPGHPGAPPPPGPPGPARHGMGMPPPGPPGSMQPPHSAPPSFQQQGRGPAPPGPPSHGGMPPPPGGSYGGPPPPPGAGSYGAPPPGPPPPGPPMANGPPPGGPPSYSGPPPGGPPSYAGPPPGGPPAYSGPPSSGPPAYSAPPPAGPPAYSGPPAGGPPAYAAPPPAGPPPPGRARPGPPPPPGGARRMPPPPPRGNVPPPPPPPPGSYGR